jgi:ureidoglycolate dehydrogenase (NAD+)
LIWSDLVGRSTHGVWRLPVYLARLEAELIKCPCNPSFTQDHQAVAIMDGDQGLGHFVGHEAMRCAIGKAEKFGIGAVGVHNSNHFGIGAYFVNLAADRNMIGLAFSNSTAKVVAHGGIKPVFGTNPIAFGVPSRNGKHMLFDMSTSAVCGSQVQKFAESGLPLPEGIAVDAHGISMTDSHNLDKCSLLPFGGAKGYGIALMIEILSSVLTGAMFSTKVNSMNHNFCAPGKNGHFFMAIDLNQMLNQTTFFEQFDQLSNSIRKSGLNDGDVRIPGDTRWAHRKENLLNGIPIDVSTLSSLDKLALHYGMPTLTHFDDINSATNSIRLQRG